MSETSIDVIMIIIKKRMAFNLVDKSLANPENQPGTPPAMLFKYSFGHNFATVAEGFLKKYNWEPRTNLTTVSSVKQLDEDRVLIHRRHESVNIFGTTWESVIINRTTSEIESRILSPNHDGSASTIERTVIKAGADSQSEASCEVFDTQGNGTAKVEVFKHQCLNLLKAIQFNKWANEQ